MKIEDRIVLFSELGQELLSPSEELIAGAKARNPWFTEDNIRKAIQRVAEEFLNKEKLEAWVSAYPATYFTPNAPKRIGIVAAGNLPLVGIQDLIHVLMSGHEAYYKPSSQDEVLPTFIISRLKGKLPVYLADKLNDLDAYIATGSGNTARYFEYYLGKKPSIIRKNRVSVAILEGSESRADLANLGNDILEYFGLGCRNVSKLYVPKGYDFTHFFESIEYWNTITLHSKYVNNYDYNKSIFLVNGDEHLDNGFLLLKRSSDLHSPISTVFFEEYEDRNAVESILEEKREEIQCVVGREVPFGSSQKPSLGDYADGVDTLAFLSRL
ncbi:acyl-CoA reductase [Leadbetterella byssophila]|uniref:acyl-CoA reductase n=1 Tax=Leadbetterella byssophila TaxID=316068 RepID=UPI0039A2B757